MFRDERKVLGWDEIRQLPNLPYLLFPVPCSLSPVPCLLNPIPWPLAPGPWPLATEH